MMVTETYLSGCFIVEPQVHEDERGYLWKVLINKNLKQP
jgi:dTDP-4-dehydrorhamnose 3,5-epimerase-like enzyme